MLVVIMMLILMSSDNNDNASLADPPTHRLTDPPTLSLARSLRSLRSLARFAASAERCAAARLIASYHAALRHDCLLLCYGITVGFLKFMF